MLPMHSLCDAPPVKRFRLVGGALCLDFCNTVGGKRGATTRENLNSYRDFISWCEQTGTVQKSEAEALVRKAACSGAEARRVLNRALELREAIYRIFAAVAEDKTPPAKDLSRLNAELALGLKRLRVSSGKDGFVWGWASEDEAVDQPLGPIARSAADLLTSAELLADVHRCQGDNCGWLFADSSRNHSRRWCDMRDCGNRAKVRRHRLKERRVKARRTR